MIYSQETKRGGAVILTNAIRCTKCGTTIESTNRHDFVWCPCKSVAVDGGKDYLRRVGNREDWEEKSLYKEDDC